MVVCYSSKWLLVEIQSDSPNRRQHNKVAIFLKSMAVLPIILGNKLTESLFFSLFWFTLMKFWLQVSAWKQIAYQLFATCTQNQWSFCRLNNLSLCTPESLCPILIPASSGQSNRVLPAKCLRIVAHFLVWNLNWHIRKSCLSMYNSKVQPVVFLWHSKCVKLCQQSEVINHFSSHSFRKPH